MTYRILYHHRIRAEDGQAVHVRELIHALRTLGHEVHECALVPKAVGDGGGQRAQRGGGGGGPWQRLRLPRAATEVLEIVYGRHGVRRLLAAATRVRPHFIYERHALHCRVGLLAARTLGVPLLLEVNSPHVEEMERLGLLRFARLARRTERAVLAGADRVLAVTEVLQERLIRRGARRESCVVIGNAAEPDRYGEAEREAGARLRARYPDGGFLMGFVGYMRDWHRLDLAVEAMARPALARVHLILMGEGPALPGVLARAREAGVAHRVHALGRVPPDVLPAHVCMLDAAIIPAINDYASPLKLFDSLAAGVVTIAPDQPNLRERITDGRDGVLFRPGSGDDLARRLVWLMEDPGRARALGQAGREKLVRNDWTWRGNARRVVEIFEAVAAGGGGR